MASSEPPSVTDFYEREVLPELARRLDEAFPEFGWQHDARGWRASNQEFTHASLGVRADRVVCHGEAPRGFLIHGQGSILWTTYVNDGRLARGRDFVDAVRQLAERTGIDSDRLNRPPTPADRKANLLHDAFDHGRRELASERGAAARDYLERRGIPPDRLPDANLGLMPSLDRLRLALLANGYREQDIKASGLLADSRWPGRIVGAWREERSRVATLWSRALADDAPDRYLYLRGAPRAGVIPYGLSDLLTSSSAAERTEITLVEGVMDVHVLRAHGVRSVAALGGASAPGELFERLADLHVARVVLAFDNDGAGRIATVNAIDAATHAHRSRDLWVIDPDLYGSAKDPGEIICSRGADIWQATATAPMCAVTWQALDLTGPISAGNSQLTRRAGLARAGKWLGSLPSRLAIEQDAVLDAVAESLNYDSRAVCRAFRARYWRREPAPETPRATEIER